MRFSDKQLDGYVSSKLACRATSATSTARR